MSYIDHDGVRLHWEEIGAGSPVLLIMGASYSSKMWYPVLPALSAKHRVIYFDNRGTGESSYTPVASIEQMAGDAIAVLDAAGVEEAHIYGVSLGGIIAQQVALQFPTRVRSLVLGCTGILTAEKPRAPKALQLVYRLPKTLLIAMSKKAAYGPACDPARAAKDVEVLRADKTERRALVAQQDALRAYSVTLAEIATLMVPALVLHGTADTVVKPEWGKELADTLPNSRWVTYEGAGHNYLVAAGEPANQVVIDFLEEVDTRQPV